MKTTISDGTTVKDYPYLRMWCGMMGSFNYYTENQLAKAREMKAPDNTIYFREDGPVTFDEVTNPEVIHYFSVRGLEK